MRPLFARHFPEKSVHLLAELRDIGNLALFSAVGVDQVVPADHILGRITSQMVFHGGRVSGFFVKAMSVSADNGKVVLDKVSVESLGDGVRDKVIGQGYDVVLEELFDHGMQLIAIERNRAGGADMGFGGKGGNGEASRREIIINPHESKDVSLDDGDSLFVLRR
jgi:hypothetical protein